MNRRIKTIGVWSLQMTASAVLSAMRNIIDPTAATLKELYVKGFPYDVILASVP
jgi:distribution and morphology protein 31